MLLLDRRRFLKGSAQVAGALMVAGTGRALAVGSTTPYTCGISLFAGDPPPIDVSGTQSGDVTYTDGFRVPAGSTLTFDPNVSTTITVSGNVVVEGTMVMKPASAAIIHTLRFTNVDESIFVGGGTVPLATDVGLWVVEAGKVDLVGAEKVAWNRTGWDSSRNSSDEVRIAPTAVDDFGTNGFATFSQGDTVPVVDLRHPLPASLTFADTFDSVHRDNIEALAASGITQGCDDGRFCPKDLVTRGQMAAFLNRALVLPPAPSAGFSDTVGNTFEDDIDRLAAAGITEGCEDGLFCPNDLVTRAQMAAFLVRALGYGPAPSAGFSDTVGHRFEDEIDRLAYEGVTLGCDDGLYCPDDFVTREQMASFLVRAFALPVPEVDVETSLAAEVFNLTRNVKIEGTPGGRAHVFIRSSTISTIKFVEIRHMGPQQDEGGRAEGVLGRYGLHFHANYDDTRGTVVDSVVIAETGFHAFVPHLSHGITLTNCVSYDTYEHAYWWDTPPQGTGPADASDDTLYADCMAALVYREDFGFRLAGFSLNAGENNTVIGCVSVGVQNGGNGYLWPETSHGKWNFRNNVGHNSRGAGTFGWHNSGVVHDIFGLVAYRNWFAGINQGAYNTSFGFNHALLVDNGHHGIHLHSGARRPTPLTFYSCTVDGPNPIATTDHHLPPGTYTEIVNCNLISTNGILADMDSKNLPDKIKVIDCEMNASTVVWGDHVLDDSELIIIEDGVTIQTYVP